MRICVLKFAHLIISVARSVNCQVNNTQILSLCFSLIHVCLCYSKRDKISISYNLLNSFVFSKQFGYFMIKLFIFMSSLIFYNQDYHCVLHQVLHIFINQVLPIFLYQEGRGHILIRI